MLANEWDAACDKVFAGRRCPHLFAAACRLYAMDRFDGILDGPDRHVKLARWMNDNQLLLWRWRRLVNAPLRQRANLLRQQATTVGDAAQRLLDQTI